MMAVLRRLRSGVPALYVDHRTRKARTFAAEYRRLVPLYPGPALEADRTMTADAWASWCAAAWVLSAAERRRARGRGRRPGELDLSRLDRRKQKAWGRYRALRAELALAASRNGHSADPLAAVHQAVTEANRR
jgi:hypothetical protein